MDALALPAHFHVQANSTTTEPSQAAVLNLVGSQIKWVHLSSTKLNTEASGEYHQTFLAFWHSQASLSAVRRIKT
jgi:lysophospholipid acyltransferase (LPLAT)-like uncharacterized protein